MITKIDTRCMSREAWLAERRKGIGGSDAGAILGMNPYKSAFDVYADKLGLIDPAPDSEAMRQGRDLEDYVARRFEEVSGKRVRRENHILHNSNYPFALANIDRAVIGEKAGLECKTTKSINLKRYKNGDFPSEYYCQCVHYMMVTGFDRWYLAVLVFGTDFMTFEIERDEQEIAALAEAERKFWDEHVIAKSPPAPSGSASTDNIINTIYNSDDGGRVDLTPFEKELKELDRIKQVIGEYEKEKRRLEQAIKLYMKDSREGSCDGYRVTWRNSRRGSFDLRSLIKDFVPEGTDLTEYYKTTKYRVFKVKEIE